MQRLFSTFPAGRPGAGLLLLRVTAGVLVVLLGILQFTDAAEAGGRPWIGGLLATLSGLSLIIGLLSPCGATVAAVGGFALALRWSATAPSSLPVAPLCASLVGVVAVAIILLGPGAYSLDARLFGRREIIIRSTSLPPPP